MGKDTGKRSEEWEIEEYSSAVNGHLALGKPRFVIEDMRATRKGESRDTRQVLAYDVKMNRRSCDTIDNSTRSKRLH